MRLASHDRPLWRSALFAALLLLMGAGLAAVFTLTALGREPDTRTLWFILAGILAALVIVIVLELTEAPLRQRGRSRR